MAELNEELNRRLQEIEKKLDAAHRPSVTPQDPMQTMKDAGFAVFTPAGQKALETIKERYNGDFKVFFTELSKKYDPKQNTAEIKRLSGVLSQIGTVTVLVDKLLNSKDFNASLEDIKDLRKRVNDLDSEFAFFTDSSNITDVLSENVAKTAQTTGVSLEQLKYAQGLFGRKVQQITKPPAFMPGARKNLQSIGEVARLAALTPFEPALRSINAMDRERAAKKESLENLAFEQAGNNVSPAANAAESTESVSGGGGGGGTGGRWSGSSGLAADLFLFFNTKAYQAKWTKELLAAVSGGVGGGRGEGGGGGGGGGIGLGEAALAGLTKMLAPVIGAIVAAQVGWMAGRWLGENIKWGGKSLDKHVEGAFTKMLGGDEKSAMKKAAKDTPNPEVRRAMELQAENPKMSIQEASAEAHQEWLGRTRQDIGGKVDLQRTNENRIKAGLPPIGKDGKPIQVPELRAAKPSETLGESATPGKPEKLPEGVSIDPANGKYKMVSSRLQQRFWGDTVEDVQRKVKDAEAAEAKSSASLYSRPPAARVPVDTSSSEAVKDQKVSTDKLNASVDEMNETMKASSKGKTKQKPSGYDANNTRNPVLGSIGAGQITS